MGSQTLRSAGDDCEAIASVDAGAEGNSVAKQASGVATASAKVGADVKTGDCAASDVFLASAKRSKIVGTLWLH